MSHAATNWAIQQRGLKPATKIVLWHLCDCYNPTQGGCFPSQDYLADNCELSRSAINVHLDLLEEAGLIAREQRRQKGNQRQERTRYFFAFEPGFARHSAAKPSPENGHGSDGEAVSGKSPEPCPENGESRVRNLDSNPVREPLKEPVSEREGASEPADGHEQASAEHAAESREAIERGFKRFYPTWPTYVSDSEPAARKAWFELTAEERLAATDRAADYVEHAKLGGRKTICSAGVYLAEKRWEKLPEKTRPVERKPAAPFGKAWGARRFRALVGPMAAIPSLDRFSQLVFDSKPEKRDVIMRDHRAKHGWPEVTRMHERILGHDDGRKAAIFVTDDDIALGEDFVQVQVGSELWEAWKRLHEARGWPWLPDPGRQEWVWFPAPHVQTGDFDRAVAAAIEAFKRRVEGEQHAAAE